MSKKPATAPRAKPTRPVKVHMEFILRVPVKGKEQPLMPHVERWLRVLLERQSDTATSREIIEGDTMTWVNPERREAARITSDPRPSRKRKP